MTYLNEFDIIKQFFTLETLRPEIKLGVGDDAAVVSVAVDKELVISTDTLLENVHFLPTIKPQDLAYRSLAVNLSDLAAMGAEPAWCLLSLTLPQQDKIWLQQFSRQFFATAEHYQLSLIGGNLARGPLSVTLQIAGYVPSGQALTRRGAKLGDVICVTGQFGLAAAGLTLLKQQQAGQKLKLNSDEQQAVSAFLHPEPKINQGLALRGLASSCIDVSDGLLVDLQHILQASHVGAAVNIDHIPITSALLLDQALNAGEDYQLCFTVSPSALEKLTIAVTPIGIIEQQVGLRLYQDGQLVSLPIRGYQHF